MTRDERALRANIVAKARWMNAIGLNQGTSGNISARYKDVLLITPSATPYDSMTPESIAAMPPERKAPGPVRRSLATRRLAFRSLIFFSWLEIFFMMQSASQDAKSEP